MSDAQRLLSIIDRARQPVHPDPDAVERLATALRSAHADRSPRTRMLRPSLTTTLLLALTSFAAGLLLAPAARRSLPEAMVADATVTFVLVAEDARQVSLVGDFNDWSPDRTRMARRTGGVWSVEVKLGPGRYNYAFVVDGGNWLTDPAAPRAVEEDFGRPSSVLVVEQRTL